MSESSVALPAVLLVEDHTLFREGMRLLLGGSPLVRARILEAGSLVEALALPDEVDLVLLDIGLPGIDGIDGLLNVRQRWPQAAILMLSAHDRPELVRQALAKGACGFVSKTAQPLHICQEVRRWLDLPRGAAPPAPSAPLPGNDGEAAAQEALLTPRQYDVLRLLSQGLSNKAIAYQMQLSENTVRNHVVAIMRLFDAQTRTAAVMAAQRRGLLPGAH